MLAVAEEPSQCRCILFALLLDSENSAVHEHQSQLIRKHTDQLTSDITSQIFHQIQALGSELKYLLIEECSPSFALFSAQQMAEFQALIDALIRADERIDLFEWSVQKIIESQLSQKSNPGAYSPHGRASVKSRLLECSIFLGAIAHFGGNPEDAEKAYEKGFRSLDHSKPAGLPSVEKCDLKAMNEALPKLSKMTPLAKRSFLDACSKVAEHDGFISNSEIQIIRGIAASISCPLGPISSSS